jgi:hypothetical protein
MGTGFGLLASYFNDEWGIAILDSLFDSLPAGIYFLSYDYHRTITILGILLSVQVLPGMRLL